MNNYLTVSILKDSIISRNYIQNHYNIYNFNVTGEAIYKLFENQLNNIFDQIQIPLGNDDLKISYEISIYRQLSILYNTIINDDNVLRLIISVRLEDGATISIDLYCKFIISENITNNTVITDDLLDEIIFTKLLVILIKPHTSNSKQFTNYLNYLKSNCVFPIYFDDCGGNRVIWNELIHYSSKIEINDMIHNFFVEASNDIYVFNNIFPKNARNFINI